MTVPLFKKRPNLLHANDATVANYRENNGTNNLYMFVAAYSGKKPDTLVKVQYSGNEYWEAAEYTYPSDVEVSGVALMSGGETDPTYKLLLRSGHNFYKVSIDETQSPGSLVLQAGTDYDFRIKCGSNNEYRIYTQQGIHYENVNGGTLYVPMWGYNDDRDANGNIIRILTDKANENVVLVYKNINNKTGKVELSPDYVWPIRQGSSKNTKFEIESNGFPKNTAMLDNLWFNVNLGIMVPYDATDGAIYSNSQPIKYGG
jgi:hypothetical protein